MSAPSTPAPPAKRTRSLILTQDSNELDDNPAGPSKKSKKSTTTSSSHSSPPPSPRTKSTRFCFSDGNIILQVGDTDFKVHRGVLESESSVFEDMFQVAGEGAGGDEGGGENDGTRETSDGRELPLLGEQEGVATVELLQDVVGAWEVMLSALYQGV